MVRCHSSESGNPVRGVWGLDSRVKPENDIITQSKKEVVNHGFKEGNL